MSEPRPRAILFDLDDTILEYDGNADQVWRSVVAEHAGGLAGLDLGIFSIRVDSAGTGLPETANVQPDRIICRLSALTDFLR